ncbi:MAG: hypothetical protein WDN66_04370 [Candidatus Saccharibacteria bacterium]
MSPKGFTPTPGELADQRISMYRSGGEYEILDQLHRDKASYPETIIKLSKAGAQGLFVGRRVIS